MENSMTRTRSTGDKHSGGTWGNPHPNKLKVKFGKLPAPDWISNADAQWKQASKLPGITANAYRQRLLDFIEIEKPVLWLTLRASRDSDYIDFHGKADKFINAILQHAHGRKWSRLPLTVRPTVFGFLEHASLN